MSRGCQRPSVGMRLGLWSLAPSRPCTQGAGQKTPEGHSGHPLPWPGRRRDSREPESSRFHQLRVLPYLCPGARRGAPGYRVAHGGCEDTPRSDLARAQREPGGRGASTQGAANHCGRALSTCPAPADPPPQPSSQHTSTQRCQPRHCQ